YFFRKKALKTVDQAHHPIYDALHFCTGSHRSALAQSVEQMTVNHWVAGSSPAGGARIKRERPHINAAFFVRGIFIFFSNAELNLSAQPPAPQSSYEFMQ